MRIVARVLYSITGALVAALILIIVLGIIFHPTVGAGSSQVVVWLIVIGETIGAFLSPILIIGGLSAAYLAITSKATRFKIVNGMCGLLMLGLGLLTLIFSGGHLPLS